MNRALTFLAVVASVAALPALLPQDAACTGAEDVAQCEADIAVCMDLFASGSVADLNQEIRMSCLEESEFDNDMDSETAVRRCVHTKRGVLLDDGTVNPVPILDDLSVALSDTRPDLLQRILNTVETCPLNDVDEWLNCALSACGHEVPTTEAPTTLAPEE